MAIAEVTQVPPNSTYTKALWRRIQHCCCHSRKDARLFWFSYAFVLSTLFIIFMVAFLRTPSATVYYLRWHNDSCTTDYTTVSPIIECDRSLRLYCSAVTARCACLNNMFWNGSFCDCAEGMYYSGSYCQERLVFGKTCDPQRDSCMEYLSCLNATNTCECPANAYYNQTTCNPKLPFNASQPCALASQCVTGLVCR